MCKVNMPGFTAEASLPAAAERYRMPGILDSNASHGKVVPQRWCERVCRGGDCFWECHGSIQM